MLSSKSTTRTDFAEVAADTPSLTSTVNYGVFIESSGKMWVNGMTIDSVSPDVPSTQPMSHSTSLPKAPLNLGFSPKPASG